MNITPSTLALSDLETDTATQEPGALRGTTTTTDGMRSAMARAVRSAIRVDEMTAHGWHADDSDPEHLNVRAPDLLMQAIRGEADPAAVLTRPRRAELAWQKRAMSWQPGMPLEPLLELPALAAVDAGTLQTCAAHVLTGPAMERLARGPCGEGLRVVDPSGQWVPMTAPHLAPFLAGRVLLDCLQDVTAHAARRFADVSHDATGETALWARLCMAQRLAAVLIHHAVRDAEIYDLTLWRDQVREALHLRLGPACGHAHMVVALARAAGLAAGKMVHWMELQPAMPGVTLQTLVSRDGVCLHESVGWVLLGPTVKGGWTWRLVRSDPSECVPGNPVQGGAFDGVTGAGPQFAADMLQGESGPHKNLDVGFTTRLPSAVTPEMRRSFLKLVALYRHSEVPVSTLAHCFASALEQEKIEPLEGYYVRYQPVLRAYRRCIERTLQMPGVLAAWPERVGMELSQLLQTPPMIVRLAQAKGCDNVLESALWQGLCKRLQRLMGEHADGCDVAPVFDAAPESAFRLVISAAYDFLQAVAPEHRLLLAEGFAKSRQFALFCLYGRSAAERIRHLTRSVEIAYRFMTEGYPDTQAAAWGPLSRPRWLPRAKQEAYVSWLSHFGTVSLFHDAAAGVLAYVRSCGGSPVADDRAGVRHALPTARALGLVDAEFTALMAFHEHLCGHVQGEALHAYRAYMTYSPADENVLFTNWLDDRHPQLASLLRREVLHNPATAPAVAEFLLRRLPLVAPPQARQLLMRFIDNLSITFVDETSADAAFVAFIFAQNRSPLTVLPACKTLFDLWKAHHLPAKQAVGIWARLMRTATPASTRRSKAQRGTQATPPHAPLDLGDVPAEDSMVWMSVEAPPDSFLYI